MFDQPLSRCQEGFRKIQDSFQAVSSFASNSLPKRLIRLLDYCPTTSKCVMLWSATMIAIVAPFTNSSSLDLSIYEISLVVLALSNLEKYLSRFEVCNQKISVSQSTLCILGLALVRIALDETTSYYRGKEFFHAASVILLTNSLLITLLYLKMLNNKKTLKQDNESDSDVERQLICQVKRQDTPSNDREILVLAALQEIAQLKHTLGALYSLIEKHADLKELFEKHRKDHAEFVAHVDFKGTELSEKDDIYERLIKVRREKRGLEHTLREIKRYINSYADLKECFWEKVSLYNEEQSYQRGRVSIEELPN